ncbi:unnamed protein product, partial [Rotaria sordida]
MSHFLILLVCFILFRDSLNTVQILGLFPEYHHAPSQYSEADQSSHWTTQSMEMFRAAITLADRYKIYVGGNPINYTILQTNSNGFAELELVCRSITNTTVPDILGVVGPTTSTNARYIGPFVARIGLPLVSYTATHAALDDKSNYPTFYRTIPSDILLAEAIVKLFKYFSWETCSMIIGNDDYGYGGLKLISEVYYANLSIKERLIFDPQSDKYQADLKQTLEKSQSRIVLVWANHSSCTKIIQHALHAGLLRRNYVWITTNKIDFNMFEQNEWFNLSGILTVVPFIGNSSAFGVNETLQKEAFDVWRNLSHNKNSVPKLASAVSQEAMYTFDAVWALIQALNKSVLHNKPPSMNKSLACFDNFLQNHDEYLNHLKMTRFYGVSGNVQFSKANSDDCTHGVMYGLYNIQPMKLKNSEETQKPTYIKVLTWYETTSQDLQILVIEAHPFVIVHNSSTDNQSSNYDTNLEQVSSRFDPMKTNDPKIFIYGFVADFIRELERHMRFTYTIHVADPTTAYHSLITLVAGDNRQYDMILSNIAMTSDRMLKVDFSTPFYDNTFRIITRLNPYSSPLSLFSCFNPFTWDVWVAIFVVIIYSSIIIYIFEYQNGNIENSQPELKAICTGIFHGLISILIMNGDIRLTTTSSRLTILGLYALGVILIATYTANLSSFLTLHRGKPFISGIDDIKNGLLPFSRIGI